MTIGQTIKSLRQKSDLSQPELAEKAGIEQSYLSKLENDKSLPSNDLFNQVIMALGVSPREFLDLLDWHTDQRKIQQIPILAKELALVASQEVSKRRVFLQIAFICIVLAAGSFFTGLSKQLFSERMFLYISDGVVFEQEPDDIFDRWHSWIPRDAENHSKLTELKKNEMKLREDQQSVMQYEYLGPQFTKKVEDGRRVFRMTRELQIARPINAWLQTLRVMLFASGVMLLWLEFRMRS